MEHPMSDQPTGQPMPQPMMAESMMPSSLAMTPVYGTLIAQDLQRAKKFYSEKLGLETADFPDGGLFMVMAGDGTRFGVYARPGMPAPQNTTLTFVVGDVEGTVRELRGRGVVFEEYDMPGLKTMDGVATMGSTKSAWFKDTEGNILSVASM
jgi:predicted enzyme related to lactoylglutathione lyase